MGTYPDEYTTESRARSETKAELCGKIMSSPYKHFGRYGYLSGSKSCNRKSVCQKERPEEDILVNTGLSMSMTSLSICTSKDTVSSSSALPSALSQPN